MGPGDLATNLAPNDQDGLQPTFTWTDPSVDSNDLFSFYIFGPTGNTFWQVPGTNSNSNGFSSSLNSLTLGMDPSNAGNDLPPGDYLVDQTTYSWDIQVQDSNGNQALTIQYFQASALL